MERDQKVTCPACGKRVTVRKDGRMREHISGIPEWPGSPFKKRCSRSSTLPSGEQS